MRKLSDIMNEVSALETGMAKMANAKNKGSRLSSVLNKIAEEMESEEEEKEEEKEEAKEEKKDEGKGEFPFANEKESKEASLKMTDAQIQKIAQMVTQNVMAMLTKTAVDASPNTQSAAINVTGNNGGKLTDEARKTDQLIPGDSVAAAANSNPEKNAPEGGDHTIEKADVNEVGNRPPALGGVGAKEATVRYTAQEAEVLQKLASVGYEYLVDYYSDQIVREKVAQAIVEEQAKDAPQKIAKAILNSKSAEKTASADTTREKLAAIGQKDPELLKAIAVLADRNLL